VDGARNGYISLKSITLGNNIIGAPLISVPPPQGNHGFCAVSNSIRPLRPTIPFQAGRSQLSQQACGICALTDRGKLRLVSRATPCRRSSMLVVYETVMTVKRCLPAAVLLILLTSCTTEPPPYVSHYVEPTSEVTRAAPPSSEAPPLPAPLASFVDNFDRPDTTLGLGEGWDLRGDPPLNHPPSEALPPATDGYIKNGRFTYNGVDAVYAVRKFQGPVQGIGARGSFRRIGGGYVHSAMSMAISANDQLVSDLLTFGATREGWSVKMRRANGPFTLVAQGSFSPVLAFDQDYQFELNATDKTVTVRVPGSDEVTKELSTQGLLGNIVNFQEHPVRKPASDVFDFDDVWVIEAGQPLSPVPN
jgi:hypothetical protein